jgi:hypothetical protein
MLKTHPKRGHATIKKDKIIDDKMICNYPGSVVENEKITAKLF